MDGILIFYLGVDYVRGTLFDIEGNTIDTMEEPVDIIISGECIEQDPEQWFKIITSMIKNVQINHADYNVNSITVTYQPGTLVCVDRSGNQLMNAILPYDRRAKHQADICERTLRKFSDGFSIPWRHMVIPKIMWIKYNSPDIYKKIYKVLTPDGYIAYRLCGETAIDTYSSAFLGYNFKNGEYNSRVFNILGIDINILPEVRRIGDCIGIASGYVRDDLNLKNDIKFILTSSSLIPLAFALVYDKTSGVLFDIETSNLIFVDNYVKTKKHSRILRLPCENEKHIYSIVGSNEMQFLKWACTLAKTSEINETPGAF